MGLFLKGLIVGFIIILPGMSGGTAFLILGLYEDMVKDILHLKLKRYLPMIAGMLMGIFISGYMFGWFFENYRDITVAILLGCLLGSVRSVLKDGGKATKSHIAILMAGIVVGCISSLEPMGIATEAEEANMLLLFVGGALACVAMIIPGVPGSSVLILFGIYDIMMLSIKYFELVNLIVFAAGSITGTFLLLKLLAKLYDKYKSPLSYFFGGLIIGSARALIPSNFSILTVLLPILTFTLVWWLGGREKSEEPYIRQ